MTGISKYIKEQLPAFYQDGGEDFIAFMEAYYEFMENHPEYSKTILNEDGIDDIDHTLEEFLVHFKNKYMSEFPYISTVGRRFVVKHVQDFYKTKGSEKSVKLLLRLLLGQEAEVYNPSFDILKPSDSKWVKPVYLECTRELRTRNFVNKQITGASSKATAFVEAVVTKRVDGKLIDIVYLSNVRGLFRVNEVITDDGNLRLAPKIVGSLTTVDVDLGGRNNKVGDIFNVQSAGGGQAKVRVAETIDATGRVDFRIIDGGYGYEAGDRSVVKVSSGVLVTNNVNLDFMRGEYLVQPREEIRLISATNFNQRVSVGDVVHGLNASNGVVSYGKVISISNVDSAGMTINDASANSRVLIYPTLGSFDKSFRIDTLAAHRLKKGDEVKTGGKIFITINPNIGSFSNGMTIRQRTYTDHRLPTSNTVVQALVNESSGRIIQVLPDNEYELDRVFGTFTAGLQVTNEANTVTGVASYTRGAVQGSRATVTVVHNSNSATLSEIVGDLQVGDSIKSAKGPIRTISSIGNVGVAQVIRAGRPNTFSILDNVSNTTFKAQVVGQNTTAVGIWGNTSPVSYLEPPIVDSMVSVNMKDSSWTNQTAIEVMTTDLGGEQAFSISDNSTTDYVTTVSNFPTTLAGRSVSLTVRVLRNAAAGHVSAFRLHTVNTANTAQTNYYDCLVDNKNATAYAYIGSTPLVAAVKSVKRGSYFDIEMACSPDETWAFNRVTVYAAVKPNGQDGYFPTATGAITFGGLRVKYANEVLSFPLETIREETMLSPPRNPDGTVKELAVEFTQVSTGAGAGFKVGSIENEETVTLLTDMLGGRNIANVPYMGIHLNGQGSSIGFLDSINVISSGTTVYSNGQIIAFEGGGYANGEPEEHAVGYAVTDSNGALTHFQITNHGMGYYSGPIHNWTGDATIDLNMSYGYGFPKMASGGPNVIMDWLLNSETITVGSITSMTRINPGANYNMNPFIWVNHEYVSSLQRKNFYVTITGRQGAFQTGERLYQLTNGVRYNKGEVVRSTASYILVRRTNVAVTVNPNERIYGSTTGSSGMVTGFFEDGDSLPIGDNADILGNVISANGIATKLEVMESGYGYVDLEESEMWSDKTPYIITGINGVKNQGKGAGYWKTTSSHLSSEKKLHDNKYYQDYSYDIRCGLSLDKYETLAKKMIHVAGTRMFGTVVKNAINKEQVKVAMSRVDIDPLDIIHSNDTGSVVRNLNPFDNVIYTLNGKRATTPDVPIVAVVDQSGISRIEKSPHTRDNLVIVNADGTISNPTAPNFGVFARLYYNVAYKNVGYVMTDFEVLSVSQGSVGLVVNRNGVDVLVTSVTTVGRYNLGGYVQVGDTGDIWRLRMTPDFIGRVRFHGTTLYYGSPLTSPNNARPILSRRPKTGVRNRLVSFINGTNSVSSDITIQDDMIMYRERTSGNNELSRSMVIDLIPTSGQNVVSALVRPVGKSRFIRFKLGSYWAIYDLNNARVVSTSTGVLSQHVSIIDVGDGWYKVMLLVTLPSNINNLEISLGITNNNGQSYVFHNFPADTLTGIDVRQVQVENGSTPTSYQTVKSVNDISEEGVEDEWYTTLSSSAILRLETLDTTSVYDVGTRSSSNVSSITQGVSASTGSVALQNGIVTSGFVINKALSATTRANIINKWRGSA